MGLICFLRGHRWEEEPWPYELGPYDQTQRAWALAVGAECYEVCVRCGRSRWRRYQNLKEGKP